MFSLLTACRRIIQPPNTHGYNTRRMYVKGVDQVLAKWRTMKLYIGGLGALMLGKIVLDFTLVMKLPVFEAHLNEMRRDIALIKGKMLGIPVSGEVLGVPPPGSKR
ncbi:hypothetical protein TWF730_002477 [Orbilia blumenaviensis]|uniref:Uncharacterized protein n=1 Tax=Orbilia blumenaviensis TaxID=1796055 RepID=A0AAV9UA62_9PEZI